MTTLSNRQAWLKSLISAWHSLEDADERQMPRGSQARILLTGLRGAGKSSLYNYLQEIEVSPVGQERPEGEGYPLEEEQEDLGLFTLVDLPTGRSMADQWGRGNNLIIISSFSVFKVPLYSYHLARLAPTNIANTLKKTLNRRGSNVT